MNKKLIAIIFLFIGAFILKDLPYINVLVADQEHIIYLAIFIIGLFLFINITIKILVFLTGLFLFTLLISTLFFGGLYSEIFGIIIYLLLIIIAIGKTISLMKSLRE